MELDKILPAFKSDLSAGGVWEPSISIENRVLVQVKFVSHVIHRGTKIATNILRKGEYEYAG